MKKLLLICFWGIAVQTLQAQTVWENSQSPVYNYLARMAQKGLIEFNDVIRPVSRTQIQQLLDSLGSKSLTSVEKKERDFYLQEFNSTAAVASETANSTALFKKDNYNRLRLLGVNNQDFKLFIDPIIGAKLYKGTEMDYRELSNGINLWGQAKRFGFQAYYRDYALSGSGLNLLNQENPQTTIIELINRDANKKNYNEIRGSISYSWKNGSISLGKDQLLMGYGETGKIILSDRAPSFPYLRLDYQPLKWLSFNYTHSFLNSNLVDSVRSYGTGTNGVSGDVRIRYIPKFLVSHSLTFLPLKGLSITVGESMVYSDKLDVGFLIPLMYFKGYDNNRSNYLINAGSNGQIFMQVSSRNHLKNTHLYATWFIDELSLTKIFNPKEARNQFGIQLGASVTDLLIPYLTLGAEYTRVNPFVYNNLLPAQEYNHYQQALGDWMGNNSDRLALLVKYTPIPKLKLDLRWWHIRKGGAGTLVDQYQAIPQPPFLFDFAKTRNDIFFTAQYEWFNNLYVQLQYQQKTNKPANAAANSNRLVSFGFSYGL